MTGQVDIPVVEAAAGEVLEETVEFHHEPTAELDENGQGDAFVSFAFAAHRAVVDVDLDLGLVRVVEITTSQDVGRVLNPVQLVGQLEGGIAQGVGLAVMEEIVLDHGRVRNPSFTDYVIPTALDMPPVHIAALIEAARARVADGCQGRRRATDDLLGGGRGGCHQRRHRTGAPEGARPSPGHRPRASRGPGSSPINAEVSP